MSLKVQLRAIIRTECDEYNSSCLSCFIAPNAKYWDSWLDALEIELSDELLPYEGNSERVSMSSLTGREVSGEMSWALAIANSVIDEREFGMAAEWVNNDRPVELERWVSFFNFLKVELRLEKSQMIPPCQQQKSELLVSTWANDGLHTSCTWTPTCSLPICVCHNNCGRGWAW